MRAERKKRKRQAKGKGLSRVFDLQLQVGLSKEECDKERYLRQQAQDKMQLYKNMSRSYWERWRWEVQKRKEERLSGRESAPSVSPQKINPLMLDDIPTESTVYIVLVL